VRDNWRRAAKSMLPPEIRAAMGEGPAGENSAGPSIPPELAQQMEEGMALIQQLRAQNARLADDRQLKMKELQIKEQELAIKGYEAETARMTATQPPVFKSPYGQAA
jgi:hypothetical protein